jgi:hypothetical protein
MELEGGPAVTQKVISPIDKAPVVERAPRDLSKKVAEELTSLVEKIEDSAKAKGQSKAGYWFYRAPFPGVRYYSWER